jgi:hypothetical protein
MSDLRSQINSLSPEKVELLDTVWESLEADADAQRAEVDCRIARYEQKPFRFHPVAGGQGLPQPLKRRCI